MMLCISYIFVSSMINPTYNYIYVIIYTMYMQLYINICYSCKKDLCIVDSYVDK